VGTGALGLLIPGQGASRTFHSMATVRGPGRHSLLHDGSAFLGRGGPVLAGLELEHVHMIYA
jgi:hypothetical protein